MILSTKQATENLIRILLYSGKPVPSAKWQASQLEKQAVMIEVSDIFATMQMESSIDGLKVATRADLPWAEEHFMERIGGEATNPGISYLSWPYCGDFSLFLKDGKFSHTYQERFWPKPIKGIRYDAGNWLDVVTRLCEDPTSRQAYLSIWHPEDQSNNGVRVPCSLGYWFRVKDGELNVTYFLRSCDARRHLRNDIYMAQRLAQAMLSFLLSSKHDVGLGKLNIWIGSLHCFETDIYSLQKQLNR
jgi:thymidylate synthase